MRSDIVIAGVGGQGTLLASRIISDAAQERGLFVRTSETIGMAQRGGSVSSHIRIGDELISPVIPFRHADILIGFELAEGARQLPRLKPGAAAVVNTECIIPVNVALGRGEYNGEGYLGAIRENIKNAVCVNARPLAIRAGDVRTLNIVLLGLSVGASILPFDEGEILRSIERNVRPAFLDINRRAFFIGEEEGSKQN